MSAGQQACLSVGPDVGGKAVVIQERVPIARKSVKYLGRLSFRPAAYSQKVQDVLCSQNFSGMYSVIENAACSPESIRNISLNPRSSHLMDERKEALGLTQAVGAVGDSARPAPSF